MIGRVSPGTKLYGYCNGYFGRDSYGEKTVIALGVYNDNNWAVAEEKYFDMRTDEFKTHIVYATGFDIEEIEAWTVEEGDW